MEAVRTELEEREKVREELHGVQVWLEAADGLLAETEQSVGVPELQVGRHHCQKLTVLSVLVTSEDSY